MTLKQLEPASPTVLRMESLSDDVVSEIVSLARSIEEAHGVRVAVINSPAPISLGVEYSLSAVFMHEDLARAAVAAKDFQEKNGGGLWAVSPRRWACRLFAFDPNGLQKWFARFRASRERFPYSDASAGAILISPAVYGVTLLSELQSQAKSVFGPEILELWVRSIVRRRYTSIKKFRALNRRAMKEHLVRRCKPNRHELHEMRMFLQRIVEEYAREPFAFVVALDGSCRPIGKALGWYWDKAPKIVFLDPHRLCKLNLENLAQVAMAHSILDAEFPELARVLATHPDRVLFIDDQTGYGNTRSQLSKFVAAISHTSDFRFMVMSQFTGQNVPSWNKDRVTQGLRLVDDKMTFRSIEVPSQQSERFYQLVRRNAEGWRSQNTV